MGHKILSNMNYKDGVTLLAIVLLSVLTVMSYDNIVFLQNHSRSSLPISSIDSIRPHETGQFDVYITGQQSPLVVEADTVLYHLTLPDTLFIEFNEAVVYFQNPHMDWISVNVQGSVVKVQTTGKKPLICEVSGTCGNGRLIVDYGTAIEQYMILTDDELAQYLEHDPDNETDKEKE